MVLALELNELTAQADQIAVGTVISKRAIRLEKSIVTVSRIRIDEPVKGSASVGDIVEVRTLGGVVDGIGMKVEGEPSFAVGERTVFFVRQDIRASLRPVGMAQGVMHIRREGNKEFVMPNRQDLSLVRKLKNGSLVNAPAALMTRTPVEEFMVDLRRIVKEQKVR